MMNEIKIVDKENANIMTLMIGRMIERNLQHEKTSEKIKNVNAVIALFCGKMSATLIIENGNVTLKSGAAQNPSATVEGSLKDFISLGAGKSFIFPVLTRGLKIRGNALHLLPLLHMFKSQDEQ